MPISSNDIDLTWQDGVLITDTFDVWRKKTNGHIANYSPIITNANIADNTIQSIKLAAPAPTWHQTTGTVTTNGTVGGFIVKGGFTSGLASSINVSATASLTPALNITSSTQHLRFNPNSTVGAWNPLVASGDYSIIGGSSAGDTKNIIIGKWSGNSHGIVISVGRVGINKIAAIDAFEVNGNISASGSITGGSLSAGSGAITGGSLSAGSGTISTTGTITGGAITGGSLSAGSGTISTTGTITGGAITGTSLSAGSGAISTTGAITGGAITGTSLAAGSGTISTTGAITGGSITGTSLTSSGNITAATPTLSTHLTTKAYVDGKTPQFKEYRLWSNVSALNDACAWHVAHDVTNFTSYSVFLKRVAAANAPLASAGYPGIGTYIDVTNWRSSYLLDTYITPNRFAVGRATSGNQSIMVNDVRLYTSATGTSSATNTNFNVLFSNTDWQLVVRIYY